MAKTLISVRVDPELLARIDARRGDTSRNEWLTRALAWALDQPIKTTTREERI